MLSRKLRKQLKQNDIVGHPECSHNWVHDVRKQLEWDTWSFIDSYQGIKPEDYIKDSEHICPIYTCTMCGGSYWSSDPRNDVEYYRLVEVKKNG